LQAFGPTTVKNLSFIKKSPLSHPRYSPAGETRQFLCSSFASDRASGWAIPTRNGGVSRAEYQAFMTDSFSKLDTNGDRVLVESEVAKVLTPKQLSSLDANKDGRASRNEFMNQVMKDFASADRGGNGHLK
jgi:hypothetical protein